MSRRGSPWTLMSETAPAPVPSPLVAAPSFLTLAEPDRRDGECRGDYIRSTGVRIPPCRDLHGFWQVSPPTLVAVTLVPVVRVANDDGTTLDFPVGGSNPSGACPKAMP